VPWATASKAQRRNDIAVRVVASLLRFSPSPIAVLLAMIAITWNPN
jgi:hypothetical protein